MLDHIQQVADDIAMRLRPPANVMPTEKGLYKIILKNGEYVVKKSPYKTNDLFDAFKTESSYIRDLYYKELILSPTLRYYTKENERIWLLVVLEDDN